jgi:adenosylcobinamide-phosphate synthase
MAFPNSMTTGGLLLACAIDAVVGDPRWPLHPVRIMGYAIAWCDEQVRSVVRSRIGLRQAGVILAIGLPVTAYAVGWLLIVLAADIHSWLGMAAKVALAYTTLAGRDLADHVRWVRQALEAHQLEDAREAVSQIVGRDTDELSEPELVRATVETVAESTSDGIVAPLFYLMLGGPPLALAYKAINTLDSMIGHLDERHRDVGWASARLDDAANWLPARITALLFVTAGGLLSGSLDVAKKAWAIVMRDGGKHPSPNSGRPEAAMAGVLGVQLGGTNLYDGKAVTRPVLGDPGSALTSEHIGQALMVMVVTYLLAVGLAAAILLL